MGDFASEQVAEARSWAADCGWRDQEYLDDYSDEEIVAGVARHYDGGWSGFIKAME